MSPKKLIRSGITSKLKEGEWEEIIDLIELNKLYALKIREELIEIQQADHKDIMEFADLIQVAFQFAKMNGYSYQEVNLAMLEKVSEKGTFGRLVLNNLNPNNPSNQLYYEPQGNSSATDGTRLPGVDQGEVQGDSEVQQGDDREGSGSAGSEGNTDSDRIGPTHPNWPPGKWRHG